MGVSMVKYMPSLTNLLVRWVRPQIEGIPGGSTRVHPGERFGMVWELEFPDVEKRHIGKGMIGEKEERWLVNDG